VPVSNGELRRRAAELGVSVSYWDWQGHEVTVSDETLAAIVAALEEAPPPDAAFSAPAAVAPAPAERSWGFAVQLYSLRSAARGVMVTCGISRTSPRGRPATWAPGSC